MSTAGDHAAPADEPLPSFGLTAEEMARLTEIVGRLSQSQLPLPALLSGMAEDMPSKALANALRSVGQSVAEGKPIEEALERAQEKSGTVASGMIRTILTTRTPTQTLFRILKYQQERAELRRTFWLRLCYPILLLFCCSLLFGIMMRVVSTQFSPIFKDFGISLPVITMLIIQMAEFTNNLGWAGVLLPPIIATVALSLVSTAINGSLHKWIDLSQFCRTLAELISADCPLVNSLSICRMMLVGPLARSADGMIDLVREGEGLADALDLQTTVPEGVADLVRWSQSQGGTGAEGLMVSAALFEARGRSQTRFLSSLFTVLSVLTVSWMIMVINMAIFLPLITLISQLSG